MNYKKIVMLAIGFFSVSMLFVVPVMASAAVASTTISTVSITSSSTVLVTLDPTKMGAGNDGDLFSVASSSWHIDQNTNGSTPLGPISAAITHNGSAPWTITLTFAQGSFASTSASYDASHGLYVAASGLVTTLGSSTNAVVLHSASIAIADAQVPTITVTSPTTNAYINSVATTSSDVSYSLSEAVASGLIVASSTGGTADASVHSCVLAGSALTYGTHSALNLTSLTNGCVSAMTLVNGSVYTFSFGSATDATGNVSATTTVTGVTYDTTAPTVSSVLWDSTTDNDHNTNISVGDDIKITFDEKIDTSTVSTTTLGLDAHTFGNSTLAWNSPTNTEVTVTLGSTATVQSGDTIAPTSAVTDVAGNAFTSTATTSITDALSPVTPVSSLDASTVYSHETTATLSSVGAANIYYTNDGTIPACASGNLYSSALTISRSLVLKAVGCDAYSNVSSLMTKVYIISANGSSGSHGGGSSARNPNAAVPATPAVPGVSPAVPATPSSHSLATKLSRDLFVGSEGDDVSALQTFLENSGFLVMPNGVAKGYFGGLTKAAVIKFQKAKGLPTPGRVGPMTREILNGE